jgi:hypothetical protein
MALNVDVTYVAAQAPVGRVYVLPKMVSAIQILPSGECGSARLGLLTQLPVGAEIEIGGPGFNEETLQVRCGPVSYYLFLADLDLASKVVCGG